MQKFRTSAKADEVAPSRSAGLQAEALLRSRRARDAAFAGYHGGFGEPAWDELLRLFAEAAKGRLWVPARELLNEASIDHEIAEPYLGWLASHHFVVIEGEDVALTERGRTVISAYLDQEVRQS